MNDIIQPTLRITPTLCSVDSVERGTLESYSFDLCSCLVRATWDNQMIRWGLDGSALVKKLSRPGVVASKQKLPPEQGLSLAAIAASNAKQLLTAVVDRLPASWHLAATQLMARGHSAMQDRSRAYARIYSPVGILPPDQYGALVLQLTQGCQWNRCSFCSFYKGKPFRLKTLPEFTQHINEVHAMLGTAINRRRSIFLGAASALNLPLPYLLSALGKLAQIPPVLPIYAFMDIFSAGPCQAVDFAALAQCGLRRIYLGVESGSSAVLSILGKPVDTIRLLKLIQAIKAGGVAVGPIFLLGAGGQLYAHEHEQSTVELLAKMPLDKQDTIFLSVLKPNPTSEYAKWANQNKVAPLSALQLQNQEQLLRQAIQPYSTGGPRLTRYDVDEFIYY